MYGHDTSQAVIEDRGDRSASVPEPECTSLLCDGTPTTIRSIRPDDAILLHQFHERLSDETVYRRFLGPHRHLRPQELDWFTQVDYDTRMALVAVREGHLLGVARYDTGPDKKSAEVAFVMADELQGRGLGTLLLEHLAAAARRRGVPAFTADTFCTNSRMQGVFRRAGFDYRSSFESELVHYSFPITPTQRYLESVLRRQCASATAWFDRTVGAALSGDIVAVSGSTHTSASLAAAAERTGSSLFTLSLPGDPTDGLTGFLADPSGRTVIVDLDGLRQPRRFLAVARAAAGERAIIALDPSRQWKRLCRQAVVPAARWADEAIAHATRRRIFPALDGAIPDLADCDLVAGRALLDDCAAGVAPSETFGELAQDATTVLLAAYGIEGPTSTAISAGDIGSPLAVRTSMFGRSRDRLLPLTDVDALELAGPDADTALRIARLLDDQPDVRDIRLVPGRAPRILLGPRRDTVDDPWVRRFFHASSDI